MKIKNFIIETDKKLKKHSYNGRTIMEELDNSSEVVDIKELAKRSYRMIPPKAIINEKGATLYQKKNKGGIEELRNLKPGDIILLTRPLVPKLYVYYPTDDNDKLALEEYRDYHGDIMRLTFFYDPSYFYGIWENVVLYTEDSSEMPKTDGSDFDEQLDEAASRKGTYLRLDGVVYHKVDSNNIYDSEELVALCEPNKTLITVVGGGILTNGKYIVLNKEKSQRTSTIWLTIRKSTSRISKIYDVNQIYYMIQNEYAYLWKPATDVSTMNQPLPSDGSDFDEMLDESTTTFLGIKEEFNECKNLKGKDLETLKEGMRIVGKKTMTILNKKGNYYNVLSESKKYKYDIDNLKYDYTHKKVKIFESNNTYKYNGKSYNRVPINDLLSADLKDFIIEGETIIIDVKKKDYNKYLIEQSMRFEEVIMNVFLAPLTADESKIVTYSELEKNIMDNKLELWLPNDKIQKILGYDDSKPLEKTGEEFNED